MCAVVEELKPEVVSFHFGLPTPNLVDRLKKHGAKILSSATSVREAKWLASRGCDAIIAQGIEAGGHRGMFLETNVATQVALFALLPQVRDAVSVPVIAAGALPTPEVLLPLSHLRQVCSWELPTCSVRRPTYLHPYRQALKEVADNGTALTNLFSGRPARGILNRYLQESGPISDAAPAFPYAATLVAPLRAASEQAGSVDNMQLLVTACAAGLA